jgi:protein arginine kinase
MMAPDLATSLLVNQEDHLRLHAWRPGLAAEAALAAVLALDGDLEADISPSYSEDLGYLTARPTHVGTGLTLSALLHLPGLVFSNEIEKVLNALRQLQFGVSGLYGAGGTVRGALFVVANLVTLGCEEEEIAADFRVNVEKIVSYENMAREQIFARDGANLEDMAWRCLAVLRHARLISAQETWDRLSNVRLGVDRGVLPELAPTLLNRAMVGARTGHLELAAGTTLAGTERTEMRAAFLRDLFAEA